MGSALVAAVLAASIVIDKTVVVRNAAMAARVGNFRSFISAPPALRHSRSVLVSRHIDRGDEAVTTSADVDDEPTSVPAVAQRASQRRHVDREVGGIDEKIRPNASS